MIGLRGLPPGLLHRLGQLSRGSAARQFERGSRNPRATQEAHLQALLQANRDTEFGRTHGFASIRDLATYRRQVPLMTSTDMMGWVGRLQAGERNLISAEPPIFYAESTGSTGKPKEVPITASYRAEFQRSLHVAMWHVYRRFPQAFRGQVMYCVGPRTIRRAPDGLEVGAMSGFNFTEMPAVIRGVYAWPYEMFQISDLRTRNWLSMQLACTSNVTFIAAIFPAPVVYLFREMARELDTLAWHVEHGRLPDWLVLTDAQRAAITPFVRADSKAAARLRHAAKTPRNLVPIVWPKLRLVYCWVSATAGLYVPELAEWLGPDVAIRDALYSASEAWCNSPMGTPEPGGPLAITSHVYEFVAADDYERVSDPRDLNATVFRCVDELDDGGRYYIVPTTASGLYRYALNDVVEVAGYRGNVPRIAFVRKGGAASNLAGEKIDESHVNDAVGQALRDAGWQATMFMLVPDLSGRVFGYTLFLELPDVAPDAALNAFAAAVEQALRAAAVDYGDMRDLGHLAPIEVCLLKPGTYDQMRQAHANAGGADAQLKIAHLVSDPDRVPAVFAEAVVGRSTQR